jgi:hypothetical protein
MRRKNLYVAEVDVYLVGLSLSPTALTHAKAWKAIGKCSYPLSEVLLQKPPHFIFGNTDETKIAITLKFVRSVTKAQMAKAFEEALAGCDKEGLALFQDALDKAINMDKGLQKGDELHFYWPKNGGLIVASGRYIGAGLENEEIAKRLLEVYIHDSKSISKELATCIKDHIDLINEE